MQKMKNRVDLMINYDCNIDCIFCYHHWFNDVSKYDFSEVKIKSTLLYWKLNWFKELYISGWEPTISPNLIFSLETAKSYWYDNIKIMTNWLRFSDIEFCQKLNDLWVSNLAISMHWYNKADFEYHANVVWIYEKFLKWLLNAKKFFDIDINIVVTSENIKNLNKHWKLLLTLWLKRVHLQHIVPNSPENKILLASNSDIKIYINDFLNKFSDKLDITLEFFPYCLIEKQELLGRFSFENDFVTNNPSMFDNWSKWLLDNKVIKEDCKSCSDLKYCNWFWL